MRAKDGSRVLRAASSDENLLIRGVRQKIVRRLFGEFSALRIDARTVCIRGVIISVAWPFQLRHQEALRPARRIAS